MPTRVTKASIYSLAAVAGLQVSCSKVGYNRWTVNYPGFTGCVIVCGNQQVFEFMRGYCLAKERFHSHSPDVAIVLARAGL